MPLLTHALDESHRLVPLDSSVCPDISSSLQPALRSFKFEIASRCRMHFPMTANLPRFQTVSPPPLESGDRLSRSEFERRYAAADVTKAELIEGVGLRGLPLAV